LISYDGLLNREDGGIIYILGSKKKGFSHAFISPLKRNQKIFDIKEGERIHIYIYI